ncbi:hypothetical protein Tco_0272095 [Tanacetum coccineum]
MANVMSLLTSLCDNFKIFASTLNSGTLPSQTVTNPRQQINAKHYNESYSPVKTSDNIEKFTDELAPLDSLPMRGNDDSTLKKEFHEVNFQVYSNPLFEFDESFKSSNVNPLFEENNKDVEIKSSSSSTLTSPEASELEDYLEKDSIPPGIDLNYPPYHA